MASNTMATWHKRTRTHKNTGRKRKNKEARKSTLSATELFAGMGEPGKPAPKSSAPAAAKKPAPAPKAKKSPAA
ncbi:MAG TPA: hypothetical protein VGL86_24600 [Polyangia bacterium]|jgi:hypothetical protein